MKKSILALSLLVGLSAAASSYAALPETVRIGTDTTYAPFSSKDAKGDFVGFDIDLGNEMCKRMQVKCTWAASEGFLKQPAGKDFAFAGSSVKDKKYFGDGTGVGLRKDDAELTAAFNKALGELRQDGTYDKMAKKYFDFNVYGD